MTVKITSLEFHDIALSQILLKLSFRRKMIQTQPVGRVDDLCEIDHLFPLTYHSLLFDYLKVLFYQIQITARSTCSKRRYLDGRSLQL